VKKIKKTYKNFQIQKTSIKGIIFVLLLLGISFIFFKLLFQKNFVLNVNQLNRKESKTLSKLYKNEKLGLSFEYPSDWEIFSDNETVGVCPTQRQCFNISADNRTIEMLSYEALENLSQSDIVKNSIDGLKSLIKAGENKSINLSTLTYETAADNEIFRFLLIESSYKFGFNILISEKYSRFEKSNAEEILPSLKLLEHKDMKIDKEWVTYIGKTSYSAGIFTVKYPRTWWREGDTLYPYGKSQLLNNSYAKLVLGAGGHGGSLERCNYKDFPGGKAYFCPVESSGIAFASFQKEKFSYIFEAISIPHKETASFEEVFLKILSSFEVLSNS